MTYSNSPRSRNLFVVTCLVITFATGWRLTMAIPHLYFSLTPGGPYPVQPTGLHSAPPAEQDESPMYVDGIYVHVDGAVLRPGVYYLPANSRVFEALEKAGGLLGTIDAEVNMARKLEDGESLVFGSMSSELADGTSDGRIDLNRACQEELQQLNGIGPVLAGRILDYRRDNGPFRYIEELVNVNGIGSVTLQNIRGHLIIR